MNAIEGLRTLEQRYRDMLVLAEANDWDALAAATEACAPLRDALQASGPLHQQVRGSEQAELRAVLERVLALDEQIRTHAEPCLASTRKLVADAVTDRKVNAVYGALAP